MARFESAVLAAVSLFLAAGSIASGQTAQNVQSAAATGFKAKRPVLGGACKICPWGALGEIVKSALEPSGYDVQICYNCNRADAPRFVAGAKLPPPYEKDPNVSEAMAPPNAPGLGPVDFGVTSTRNLWNAFRGKFEYAADGPHKNLRLIANIQSPNYLLIAARAELGISDLGQIRQKRWPVRIYAQDNAITQSILAYYGLSRNSIEAAGGHIGSAQQDRKTLDVIIYAGGGLATAPEWNVWYEVSQRFDLEFIELPKELLAKIAREQEMDLGTIPYGLIRGIERRIPTVVRTGHAVYGRADMPDDFAYTLAKALDEHQDLLQWSHLNFSYNNHNVWKAYDVPLHPGAARYYKSVGYMK